MAFLPVFPVETYPDGKLPIVHFLTKVLLTCLQFFVPISRAMEQKLLKYVPCNTLNSDSSAPLHWTTEDSCSVTSSSPGRSLVGVWQREFPSVTHGHRRKNQNTDYSRSFSWQKGHYTTKVYIYYICTDFGRMCVFTIQTQFQTNQGHWITSDRSKKQNFSTAAAAPKLT